MRHENLSVGVLSLQAYTVATAPPAAQFPNAVILVSDGGAGSPCLAVSNGTNWKVVTITSTTVSAT